jgi:YggT family protein
MLGPEDTNIRFEENYMDAIVILIIQLLRLYSFILLARALISWIPNLDPYHPAVQILYQITEPVLEPIRKLIPPIGGTLDISIIVAFFGISLLSRALATMM